MVFDCCRLNNFFVTFPLLLDVFKTAISSDSSDRYYGHIAPDFTKVCLDDFPSYTTMVAIPDVVNGVHLLNIIDHTPVSKDASPIHYEAGALPPFPRGINGIEG